MKRRILSMILALCMIVGLLPAVAVPHAHAAVTTRTIQAMKGTEYEMTLTATSDGATVSYTKNQEITLKDEAGNDLVDEEGKVQTEWVQVPADETDWNAKYYYNAETGRFTLEMKGVKVTKACTYAFGVNDRSVTTQGGVMEVVIVEDSYFENCLAIGNRTAGAYRWSHVMVTSQGDATMYVDNTAKPGTAGISSLEKVTINANLDIKTKTAWTIYGQAADINIDGGNLKLEALYAGSGTAYPAIESDKVLTINGGNVTAKGATKAFAAVPTLAEGLCYEVKDFKGNALTAADMTDPQIEFKSYPEHTAGAWAEGKTACAICGAAMECAHEYTETITKAPTCTAEGEALKACSICGVSETLVVEKVPHTYVAVDGEVVDGAFDRTYTCSVCNDTYTESVKVMSGTVTLFGTAVTVDTDATTADIPEALYWVNGEEGGLPVAATAADNWNYRFTIVDNAPTVTLRDAAYTGTASVLTATFNGVLMVAYEGTNNIKVPYSSSATRSFITYNSATNNNGHLKIVGAEDAVLNVTGGDNNTSMIGTGTKAKATISGGSLKVHKTNAGGVYGAISFSYGNTTIENCNLDVKVVDGVGGKHPAMSTYPLTIKNSNVKIETNAHVGLCAGVFQSNMKGVLYSQTVTIDNSDLKIITNSNSDTTAAYNGVGLYAGKVVVKSGNVEIEALKQAIYGTVDLASYNGCEIYTAKDGALVEEYAESTYLKLNACSHPTTEIAPDSATGEFVEKCTRCDAEVKREACEHAETKVTIEGADFVTVCAACGYEIKRETAPALETPYTMTIHGGEHKLTHYDIPIYLVQNDTTAYYWTTVQEEVAVTDPETGEPVLNEDGTPVTELQNVSKAVSGAYITQTKTGATEENYNAKLIWHSGDAAPTLYLRDFVIDAYNEEVGGKWRNNGSTKSNAYTTAALFTDSTAPLTIIVDGACVLQTFEGIHYRNELTIKGADEEATLTMYTQRTGILPTKMGNGYAAADAQIISGNKLTLDVNLDITMTSWANADYGKIIRAVGADMVINGGNIVTKYTGAAKSMNGISVLSSGNLYINGGYVYSASYNSSNNSEAAFYVAGNVYITGGTVVADSASQSGFRAANFYISGGQLVLDVHHGGLVLHNADGVIEITGGSIESTSTANSRGPFMYYTTEGGEGQNFKTPSVTAPENCELVILAGAKKDTAVEILDTAIYGYTDKYMKLEFKNICLHPNATSDEEIITEAGCTQVGSKKVTTTCPDCGEVTEEVVTINAKGHTEEPIPGKDATCTETGLTEGAKCSVCGEILVEQEEIDTLEHDWIYLDPKDPSCTEPGYTEGEKCALCGEVSIEQEEIEAFGHSTSTTEDKKDATCTEAGYIKTTEICDICGETISESTEEIKALGHTEKTDVETKDATCTEAGYTKTTVTCTVCGETISESTETIDALGHTPAEAVKENETATGYDMVVYCSVCKAELSRESFAVEAPGECVEHVYTDDNDAVCNNCGYVRQMTDEYKFENYRVVFADSNTEHKNPRVEFYKLGEQTVADPTSETALRAIDAGYKTYWGNEINTILATEAGNYVALLKYNVGTTTVKVPLVFSVDADPKLIIDKNNKLTVLDNTDIHGHLRIFVYYLGDQTVEDIYDDAALQAIDPDAAKNENIIYHKMFIDKTALTKGGNYVVHLCWNIGTGPKITKAQQFTVFAIPTLTLDVNNMLWMSDDNAENNNHRLTIYKMADDLDLDSYDIYNETQVKKDAISTSKTYWGAAEINGLEIYERGNYIIHLNYSVGTSAKRTIAIGSFLNDRPVASVTDENKLSMTFTDPDITNARVYYYYFGENSTEGLDLYDKNALKNAAISANTGGVWGTSDINKHTLKNLGKYVIHFEYNVKTYNEDGTAAGSAKKVVVVETTIYNPTKPVATLGEGNKLVVEHNNPDATNIRATIYNLGDETVEDIYNETALKAIDSAAKTKWGLTEINKTALEAGNNYVILVKYNVGTQTRTVAFQFAL